MEIINNRVLSVRELLSLEKLAIPAYQRPYRWGIRNITDLFTDLGFYQSKSTYRLGSIVFHHSNAGSNDETLDIVDGQQRTLTLMLTVKALIDVSNGKIPAEEASAPRFQRQDIRQQLKALEEPINSFMGHQHFPSQDSELNLRRNYLELCRLVARPDFDDQRIDFLLNCCQVVCFVLEDISEAFQFFDSQNARGRDLAPHDLLKAFHLREFAEYEASLKAKAVAHWECLPSKDLDNLFALYLYRVRQWSEGKSARYFGKGEVDIFKGVNIDRVGQFPYVQSLHITHRFVDEYNRQYQRKIDGPHMAFPFRLDQTIINGRRFFEMAEHYQKQVADTLAEASVSSSTQSAVFFGEVLTPMASKVLATLNSYERRYRTGDRYVRAMFDCALIFYIDKFGGQGVSLAIEKCFIWAYRCRIRQQVVQLATMDNYVLEHNLIRAIRGAHLPSDLHDFPLPIMKRHENKNNSIDEDDNDDLVKLFREMKYYE